MKIAIFGSSILSPYCNDTAAYYRGIVRALHERGHQVAFYESDAFDRQLHRDMPAHEWARVVVYSSDGTDDVSRALDDARNADMIVKAGNAGPFDELLEAAVLEMKSHSNIVILWDAGWPPALERIAADPDDTLRLLIPQYDFVFVRSCAANATAAYVKLGARLCVPVYDALDPVMHYRVQPDERFAGDMAFCGNRLPGLESRLDDFFFAAATHLPQAEFVLAGTGWQDKAMPANIRCVGQLHARDVNAFNSTPLTVLNVCSEEAQRGGYLPPAKILDAAGAAACIISDNWENLESFLEPGREVLVARNGLEVAELLHMLTSKRGRATGEAARKRVLAQHTFARRVELIEKTVMAAIYI